jgi:hypothetical protein
VKPTFEPQGLAKTKAWEYVTRFVFGGIVTACAGLVTHAWGPAVGGLFLGFPAILPASLTLVKQHDGRDQAIDDARGGVVGSVALAFFALLVWKFARLVPMPIVLGIAGSTWLAVGIGLWWSIYRRGRDRDRDRDRDR